MRPNRYASGFSILELLIVVVVMTILAVIALPQVISARRLLRFNGLAHEIASQFRFARQQAMSQRQAFRVRYDHVNKQIEIIDNEERGTINSPLVNNTNNDRIVKTIPLASAGIPASDIAYARISGSPTTLADGTSREPLAGNQVEVTFQPDGSVLDTNGNPTSTALFFYNNAAPNETAFAVSILGAGGRVKVWRYNKSANLYIE